LPGVLPSMLMNQPRSSDTADPRSISSAVSSSVVPEWGSYAVPKVPLVCVEPGHTG
jgi:hypothetical protein